MLPIFDSYRDFSTSSVLLRLLLATLCGALVGLERSYKNRPAGFRTHMLVCIGACTASMTGIYLYLVENLPTDISRMGAQVIAGLGFLGAGTIIVTKKHTVKGLTTAAGLWVSGVMGLAIGAGFYEGGILVMILILVVETVFAIPSMKVKKAQPFSILLQYDHTQALDQVMRHSKDLSMAIVNLQVRTASLADEPTYTAQLSLRPSNSLEHDDFIADILQIPGIVYAEII